MVAAAAANLSAMTKSVVVIAVAVPVASADPTRSARAAHAMATVSPPVLVSSAVPMAVAAPVANAPQASSAMPTSPVCPFALPTATVRSVGLMAAMGFAASAVQTKSASLAAARLPGIAKLF